MQWRRWSSERWQLLREETRFSRRQLIVVCGLSAVMLAGGALSAREARLNQVIQERPAPPKKKPAVSRARRATKQLVRKVIVVHVSGAVASPGLYRLRSGSRAADAVHAAGGMTAEANSDALNLASFLKDGQKVFLPRLGEPTAAAVAGPGTDGQEQALVDLNSASLEQLDSLDGIGPVLARRIIDQRQRQGQFASVDQLDDIEGIGPKKLSLIKNRLIVQ